MQVYFPVDETDIESGAHFTEQESSLHPHFVIDVPPTLSLNGPSVLVLYDETAGYLHLLAYGELNHGELVTESVSYTGPKPPAKSGPHKYTFILYDTDAVNTHNILTSGPKMPSLPGESGIRAHFPLDQFEKLNNLRPITSLFFIVENP